MRIYDYVDSGPHSTWYTTDEPAGTLKKDAFGDDEPVVEVPDELWQRYVDAKTEIAKMLADAYNALDQNSELGDET